MEPQEWLIAGQQTRERERRSNSNLAYGMGDESHTPNTTDSPFHQSLRNPLKHPFSLRWPGRDNEMKGFGP